MPSFTRSLALSVLAAAAVTGLLAPASHAATQTAPMTPQSLKVADPDPPTACYRATFSARVRVAPFHNAPAVRVLKPGQFVRASMKLTNGFRQLGSHRWVSAAHLVPVKTETC